MAVANISLEIYIEQMEFDKLKDKLSLFAHSHPYPHPKSQYMYVHVSFGKVAYDLQHTAEDLSADIENHGTNKNEESE